MAAQNFTMPALSPTMTEGSITNWKVKEGDSFSAGDVLLEIETDKASMDVEAQDDGIMAKIMQGDGTKGIQVGSRIAVIAEAGDDLSSLAIPKEDGPAASSPKEEAAKPDPAKTSPSQAEAPPASKNASSTSGDQPKKSSTGKGKKQTRPLLPSVEHLMHQHGLDMSAVESMTPTGPNNRLLKGDVLAYLGSIKSSYPSELSSRILKLSHLDLSNIKLASPPPAPKATASSASVVAPEPDLDLEVAMPISMSAVIEVQKRIQSTLGVFMPLSTFIARATDVANDDLPRGKSAPTADELFNQVLGLDNVTSSAGVRGNFLPQITALPESSMLKSARSPAPPKRTDIIDILSGAKTASKRKLSASLPGVSTTTNIFSVSVPKTEARRAKVFLERVKAVLEEEPGRLVL